MSKLYKTTGVYTEEIPRLPPSIASVETAVPAFIGYTPKAQKFEIGDLLLIPTRISSMAEYEKYFGTRANETVQVIIQDEIKVENEAESLATRNIDIRIPYLRNNMYYHLQSYFNNGGGPCYIVSTGKPRQAISRRDLKKGLDEVYQYAEPTLLIFPDGIHLGKAGDLYQLYNDALHQAYELGDRFVLMDVNTNDLQGRTPVDFFRESITGGSTPASLRYGGAYYPSLQSNIPFHYADSSARITHEVILKKGGTAEVKRKGEFDHLYLNNPAVSDNEIYPVIKEAVAKHYVILSPSSIVAGVFATMDRERGVWKAPANVALNGITGPLVQLNDAGQSSLNIDTVQGKSINAIRYFSGKGTLLWGARTLAGNDAEWRYISVRRFFNMVDESVRKGINGFVFEPNDANTWVKVKTVIENYLYSLWRAGALCGAKAEHAFYVKAGIGESMTAQDILEGRMRIDIGLAPVRPGEFILLNITLIMHTS